MTRIIPAVLAPLAALALFATPAAAQEPPRWSFAIHGGAGVIERDSLSPEQDAAYRAAQQGRILPLPVIRARIRVPGAHFIGAEFDGRIYRLKFMRGTEVIWIDVEAHTGRVVGRQ